jgi:hypothetical protein
MRPSRLAPLVLLAATLAGCSSGTPSPEFRVDAGGYARAFDAAREVLRASRFTLNRVDARAGIITTDPKPSAGLATPWDLEQSTPTQEIDDLLNQQRRRVRVSFAQESGADRVADLLESPVPLTARVEVVIDRVHVRGTRPSSKAILLSSQTYDPQATAPAQYEVPVTRDEYLESRLAAEIRRKLESSPPQNPARQAPEPAAGPN